MNLETIKMRTIHMRKKSSTVVDLGRNSKKYIITKLVDEPIEDFNVNIPLIMLTLISCLGGFLFGYDTGIISGAIISLDHYFSLNISTKEIIVSGAGVGAIVGSLISPLLNKYYGRKKTIIFSGIIFVAGAFLMAISWNIEFLIIGRIIVGLGIGLASTTVPMYISECSPAKFRGRLLTLFQIQIVFGQFIAYGVAYAFSADLHGGWRWMFGLGSCPAIVLIFGMLFLPESPRLLIAQGDIFSAKKSLNWLRGTSIDHEVNNIISAIEQDKNMSKMSRTEVLQRIWRNPGTRLALIVGIGLQLFQQIIGINTVMYYSGEILKASGYADRKAILGSLYVALVGMVSSLFSLLVIDSIGRRSILIASTFGVVSSLFVLSISFYLTLRWLAIIALCSYLLFFQIGLGPIPWIMNAEIFPLWAREVGIGITTSINWIFNLLVSLTFLSLANIFSGDFGAVFLLYSGLGILGIIFFTTKVPETKGKKLEDITHMFVKLAAKKFERIS